MRETFVEKKFQAKTLVVLDQINDILAEYAAQGFSLTVRQLYYQLVARGLIPNTMRDYKRIVSITGDGRLAGIIDWNLIVDRERPVVFPAHYTGVGEIARESVEVFRLNRWADQDYHVEVMVEKKALEGILIPVCDELDVRFTANRGYSSLSAMYLAGERIYMAYHAGKQTIIFYLGDHDPSGLDMDRDIEERVTMFSAYGLGEVSRLALLRDQIDEMDIPENPTKFTDSRAPAYVANFGLASWELDAMEPNALANLVREAVLEVRDEDVWNATIEAEEEMRAELQEFADQYPEDDDD